MVQTEDGLELLNATSKCPFGMCNGSGLMLVVKDNLVVEGRNCRCDTPRQHRHKIQSAKIPFEYREVSVNSFDTDIYTLQENQQKALFAKRVAIKYVENFERLLEQGKGLYFYSHKKGTGKTRLAISVANALIKKYNRDALYISSVNLLNEVRKTFQKNAEQGTYDLIEMFKEIPLLIIDDLGVEKATDWSEEMFTQIFDERMNNKKPTIITSNHRAQDLSKKYTAGRVGSRIEKMTFPVPMPEESIRSIHAQRENEELARMFFQ